MFDVLNAVACATQNFTQQRGGMSQKQRDALTRNPDMLDPITAGLTGTGVTTSGPLAKTSTPPVTRRTFFLESKIMEAEKRCRGPRLPVVYAECEDELDLSQSGHQFYTNRLCKDGFDVRLDWRFMPLPNLFVPPAVQRRLRNFNPPDMGRSGEVTRCQLPRNGVMRR